MVDAVVQVAMDKVASPLIDQGISLLQVPVKIKSVKEQMRTLQSYLKDAESKKTERPAVRDLIIKIRDVAQDLEDLLDTYFTEIEPGNSKGALGSLKKVSRFVLHCKTVCSINNKISEIEAKAASALEESKNVDLEAESEAGSSADVEMWNQRKKSLRAVDEPEIVGRDKILTNLKKTFLDGSKKCHVLSIVGPGGVGKTTVARKLFNETKHKFKYSAMVSVSQDRKVEELLREIAEEVGLGKDKMDDNLDNNLYLHLKDKRYLLFLDDVWNTKTWDQLKSALAINSKNGSRIIVTSRARDVGEYIRDAALYAGGDGNSFPLGVLSKKHAQELFQHMISPDSDYEKEIRKPVRDLGEKIVDKCDGLPLAIQVVVGMLRGKPKTVPVWSEVLGKISQISGNDCLKMLALSYTDLPRDLKPLFLYFGIFPENREILVPQLIPLWVAENFIRDDGQQDNYVENRINDLSSRNLIQIDRRKFDGRVRSCRVHSLVRELCRRLAEESNYFCTRNNLISSNLGDKVRRVTTSTDNLNKGAFQGVSIPKLRALFCFSRDEELFAYVKKHASEFKFLRLMIVEFEDGKLFSVPEEIGDLTGLIYLKLVGDFSEIPEGIRKLKRLQTLEIRSKDIPEGILQMKHVKHLFLTSLTVVKKSENLPCFRPREVADDVEVDLPKIESLDVNFGPNISLTASSVKKLTGLKRLGIDVNKKETLEGVFPVDEPVLPKLEALKLKINVSLFYEMPKLDLSYYQNLSKLNLYFDAAFNITDKLVFPPHVVKISIKRVIKMEDHMDSLKRLPKLESIKLKKCKADKLDFSAEDGYFPQLQSLLLKYTAFNEVIIDEYGVSKLSRFRYVPSPLSENAKVPSNLYHMMHKDAYEELLNMD